MPEKNLIIIGAGMAGLSAGCYARMNGYSTQIFEMHDKPGGACTSWKRKGYVFDFSIHNLAGSGSESDFRSLWEELGALRGSAIIDHEEFVRVEGPEGKSFTVYRDIDRLERHMKELAPGDARVIDDYIRGIRKMTGYNIMAMQLGGFGRKVGVLPYIGTISKWAKVTVGDYGSRFKDPFMRQAFPLIHYGIPSVPMIGNMATLALLHKRDMGWPTGGSLPFAMNIERRYLELGGRIDYGKKVDKVIVRDDRAVGVRLADGTEHLSDHVVSAADGYATIYQMLDGKYVDPLIDAYYQQWMPDSEPFGSNLFIGTTMDIGAEPHAIALLLDRPVVIEGKERDHLDIELFSDRTGLAPPGKSVIKVVWDSSYSYWKELRQDKVSYDQTKKETAEAIIKALEVRFPGLTDTVEAVDLATPVTNERYMGVRNGFQCWGPKENAMRIMQKGLSRKLPGLKSFHMSGQWAMATTGLTTAALDGKNLIKEICKGDGKRFVALRPSD